MMDAWSYQMSAQIVERMQREGVEVVEGMFEQERQPSRLRRLITALYRQLRARSARPAETVRVEGTR